MSVGAEMVAVVIGRNEGARLPASLKSAQDAGLPSIYVDSDSTDDSVASARRLSVPVLELSRDRPFSAARARNEGLTEALRLWPATQFVMFLDGDCILKRNFPGHAITAFVEQPKCGIVTGHLSERRPEASIYHRLCAIEWRGPAGTIENFGALGGIMAARVSSVQEAGGFNEQVIAGEDSDLGLRVTLGGWSVIKIDAPMAVHDANMTRFKEWWKRSVRAGHSFAQRYSLNGRTAFRDCRRELISSIFWGFLVPALTLLLLWPSRGFSLLLLGGYGLLAWRVYTYYVGTGVSKRDAALASQFMLYSKFANFVGVLHFVANRLRGSFKIIEYK